MFKTVVVIPNWNGLDTIAACIDSLQKQSIKAHIIVVDNGSVDSSVKFIESNYPEIELIKHEYNKGFTGGVNAGFKRAIELRANYVAAFNNDAVADKNWLKNLADYLDGSQKVGIAASKILSANGDYIDSTGDYYTNWGLSYPRGRGESDINKYDELTDIFSASGGASLYRVSALQEIGLFDDDFFAYYEDVDLSFRAQLAGWKIAFIPKSIVYHKIGATSSKIKGFTTYQTVKNLPILFFKNVPTRYLFKIGIRLALTQILFVLRAISRGQIWAVTKGVFKSVFIVLIKVPKKRHSIQSNKKVSDEYIWKMIVHDLPPNAKALRKLRSKWWKLVRK